MTKSEREEQGADFFMKQKTLFKISSFTSEFGGSLLQGRRKYARPLSNRNAIKIVLRGDTKKSGSLLKHRSRINQAFANFAKKFHVKVYEIAIVSNHCHFVALFQSRDQYRRFIRSLTGTLAKQTKVIWVLRPWSRILAWGRSFQIAVNYVIQNHREAIGEIPFQPRKIRKPPS